MYAKNRTARKAEKQAGQSNVVQNKNNSDNTVVGKPNMNIRKAHEKKRVEITKEHASRLLSIISYWGVGCMDIERLREFVCLARTLNYHKAANLCYVNQSTLSKHIIALERELGCPLLVRTKADVSLTPFGETLLNNAIEVIEKYDACIDSIDRLKEDSASSLTIGYLYEASHKVLTAFYSAFHEKFGDCQVHMRRLSPLEPKRQLDEGVVDLVIDMDIGYDDSKTYHKMPFYCDRYCAIVAPNHPFGQRKSIALEELNGETIIVRSGFFHDIDSKFLRQALCTPSLKDTEFKPLLSDPTELPWYIHSGEGVGLVAGHVFQGLHDPTLVCIPLENTKLNFNVSIIWKPAKETRTLKKFVRMFNEMSLNDAFQDYLPAGVLTPNH